MLTDVTRAIQRERCGRVSLQVWERSDKLSVDTEEGAEKMVSEDENHNQGKGLAAACPGF